MEVVKGKKRHRNVDFFVTFVTLAFLVFSVLWIEKASAQFLDYSGKAKVIEIPLADAKFISLPEADDSRLPVPETFLSLSWKPWSSRFSVPASPLLSTHWLHIPVPPVKGLHQGIFIPSFTGEFSAFLGEEKIYISNKSEKNVAKFGKRWHLINISPSETSRDLFIQLSKGEIKQLGPRESFYIGDVGELMQDLFLADIERLWTLPVFLFVGLFSIVLWLRGRDQLLYLWFGGFNLSLSIFCFNELKIRHVLYLNPDFWAQIRVSSLIVIPVFFGRFFEEIMGAGKWSLNRRLWQACLAFALFAFAGIFFGFLTLRQAEDAAYFFMALELCTYLLYTARLAWSRNPDALIFSCGILLTFPAVLHDILGQWNFFETNSDWYPMGALAFVSSLIAILVRRIAITHHRLEHTKEQLEDLVVGTREMASSRDLLATCLWALHYIFKEVSHSPETACKITLLEGKDGEYACYDIESPEQISALLKDPLQLKGLNSRHVEKSSLLFDWGVTCKDDFGSSVTLTDSGLEIVICPERTPLAFLSLQGITKEHFNTETEQFVKTLANSLGVILTNINVFLEEKRLLSRLVTLASSISDGLNSPLLVLMNVVDSLDKSVLHAKSRRNASEVEQENLRKTFEDIEQKIFYLKDSAISIQKLSVHLAELRDEGRIESTESLKVAGHMRAS